MHGHTYNVSTSLSPLWLAIITHTTRVTLYKSISQSSPSIQAIISHTLSLTCNPICIQPQSPLPPLNDLLRILTGIQYTIQCILYQNLIKMRVTIRINCDGADLIARSKWLWHANFCQLQHQQQQQHYSNTRATATVNGREQFQLQLPLPDPSSPRYAFLWRSSPVGKSNLHFKSAQTAKTTTAAASIARSSNSVATSAASSATCGRKKKIPRHGPKRGACQTWPRDAAPLPTCYLNCFALQAAHIQRHTAGEADRGVRGRRESYS